MITPCEIPDVLMIEPKRFDDERGYFSETFNQKMVEAAGLPNFVQDNESFSREKGTVRGLHLQSAPFAQAKLVRCAAGAILDVAVDVRASSATYGRYVARELRGGDGRIVYLPVGFAHGFCTLEAGSVVAYKVSARYSPDHEVGLAWDDPELKISWPVAPGDAVLSERDRKHPRLRDLGNCRF